MEKQQIEYYAKELVDAGNRVHKEPGPGLLESANNLMPYSIRHLSPNLLNDFPG